MEYRSACFEYLLSRNILPSSEEVTDWAMKSLVFAHYGPYDFMLAKPGSPRKGIPTPLYNLVYHDCMILPWPMDRNEGKEDYMLYALLNGGGAYLDKDGAYPNCDGAFDDPNAERDLDEQIAVIALLRSFRSALPSARWSDMSSCTMTGSSRKPHTATERSFPSTSMTTLTTSPIPR